MKNIAIVSLIFSCFYVLNAQTIKTGVVTINLDVSYK